MTDIVKNRKFKRKRTSGVEPPDVALDSGEHTNLASDSADISTPDHDVKKSKKQDANLSDDERTAVQKRVAASKLDTQDSTASVQSKKGEKKKKQLKHRRTDVVSSDKTDGDVPIPNEACPVISDADILAITTGSVYENDDVFIALIKSGLKLPVAEQLMTLFATGITSPTDWDTGVLSALRKLNESFAEYFLTQIQESLLFAVRNKTTYLMMLLSALSERIKTVSETSRGFAKQYILATRLTIGCSRSSMEELINRTKYSLEIMPGLRIYGGPPPDWDGPIHGPDDQGHEVNITNIPHTVYEDSLVPLFEKYGKIWDLRLVVDSAGKSKGFAFLKYCDGKSTVDAVNNLDGHFITPDKQIHVRLSEVRKRLYLGRIPKTLTKDEILKVLRKESEGVTDVIIHRVAAAPEDQHNGGYCFVDYGTQLQATRAKWKFENKYVPFAKYVVVDWGTNYTDDQGLRKAKSMIIKNLPDSTDTERISELLREYGEIENVTKKDNGMHVDFKEIDDCLKAVESLDWKEIDGSIVSCSLVMPEDISLQTSKVLLVKNIRQHVPQSQLEEMFGQFGVIESSKRSGTQLIVHYRVRQSCLDALEAWNGKELDEMELSCSLMKPESHIFTKARGRSGPTSGAAARGSRGGGSGRGRGSSRGRGGNRSSREGGERVARGVHLKEKSDRGGNRGGGRGGSRGGDRRGKAASSNLIPLGTRKFGGSSGGGSS